MRQNRFTYHAQTALGFVEYLGLIAITVATVIAFGVEIQVMVRANAVTLGDLLLMFLYLEVLAMVGLYFKSGKLPVRFPIYIAIVALARYLVLDMKNLDFWPIMGVAGAILMLTIGVLVIRFGDTKYPSPDGD